MGRCNGEWRGRGLGGVACTEEAWLFLQGAWPNSKRGVALSIASRMSIGLRGEEGRVEIGGRGLHEWAWPTREEAWL